MSIYRQVPSRPQGARTRQTATISECRFRWLLVRDLNPRIRAERNLARSAWRFIKITKGGLKQFAQCVVMERLLMAQSGRFASEPEAVALDCALRFESPPDSRPSMLCLCRAWCFCRLQSSYRCCRSSRRLRRLINGRRHAGTATASCRVIISHRIAAFQLTPSNLRFRAWRGATGVLGISIQSQVITGTMATGTISADLAFTAVAIMAAASALAGRGRRSGRSGIAADQAIA